VQAEPQKTSPLDLLTGVWGRRKWLGIFVFAAPFSAVVPLVVLLPKIYQATATVVVERQQVPEAFVRSTVTSELETRLQTISQEVLSRARLEQLITRFGLHADTRRQLHLDELIERMRADIKLEFKEVGHQAGRRQGQAPIAAFALSYRGSDPKTVASVTNALASLYVEENLKVRERQAAGTSEFLRFQLEDTRKRLDEQERKVSEFKKSHIGELPQQLQANLAALEQLNLQLRINVDSEIRMADRRDAIQRQLAEAGSSMPTEGPDATATRIARLRQELAALRTRFSEKYPDVVRIKAEIEGLERQLSAPKSDRQSDPEPSSPPSPQALRLRQALDDIEADIKVLKTEEKRLRTTLATYHQRVENAPRREQEFQEMSRDYETTKALYNSLLSRSDEAQLAESMEQRQKGEQFRILDPALPPREPVAPKRLQLLLMGLALSFGLALGAVLLAEQLDTSFHTVDDLRAFTTVPVLLSVPRIVTPADTLNARHRFRLVAAAAVLGLILIVLATYFVANGNEQLVWTLAAGRS